MRLITKRGPDHGNYTDPAVRFYSHTRSADGHLLWTGYIGKGGYGQFWVNELGRPVGAHVFACELKHGPNPGPGPQYDAGHTCRLKHCVEHVEWQTRSQNILRHWADGTMPHGEGHHMTYLTEGQVRVIRNQLRQGVMASLVAESFGTSLTTICDINSGVTWGFLDDGPEHIQLNRQHRRGLTFAQVREIKAHLRAGRSQTSIAAEYGVVPSTISNISTGKHWADVE
jgi:hypothetical protein